jgi:hypothetical protein
MKETSTYCDQCLENSSKAFAHRICEICGCDCCDEHMSPVIPQLPLPYRIRRKREACARCARIMLGTPLRSQDPPPDLLAVLHSMQDKIFERIRADVAAEALAAKASKS